MKADYIWQCNSPNREARFGAEKRVWQQWEPEALTTIWVERDEKAAAEAAAVDWTWLFTAGTSEPTVEAVEKTTAAAVEAEATAEAAQTTTMDWTCFVAVAEEAEEEWWQQQAADQDVQQWVRQVEEQAATGEAEVVGAATAETAGSRDSSNADQALKQAGYGIVVNTEIESEGRMCQFLSRFAVPCTEHWHTAQIFRSPARYSKNIREHFRQSSVT